MVRQLGVQRRLDQRLLESDARRVDRLAGHRPGQELRDKLFRDRGQTGYDAVQLLGSARHKTPPWRWLCPAHRITDRLKSSGTRSLNRWTFTSELGCTPPDWRRQPYCARV